MGGNSGGIGSKEQGHRQPTGRRQRRLLYGTKSPAESRGVRHDQDATTVDTPTPQGIAFPPASAMNGWTAH